MAPHQMFRPPMDQQHQMAPTPQHAMPPSASHPISMQQPPLHRQLQQQQWQMPPQGPNHVRYPRAFTRSQYPSGPSTASVSVCSTPAADVESAALADPLRPLLGCRHLLYSSPGAYAHIQALPQPTNPNEVRTLWIGDLQYWMDESYVYNCFVSTREGAGGRDNGETGLGNKGKGDGGWGCVKKRWEKRGDDANDYTIFVGDLAPDVTDYILQETFRGNILRERG
ncbi:hypothetical protein HPP92_027912 [Vanilla planifolia]|uniref:Uncharacterized protein n=1 Tax=Vanilla planifolia TaxID=51239 RepID=A0A835PAM0_VANPL|nr:hypothetical protein HPP92_027912 [Vanilla planifolia]